MHAAVNNKYIKIVNCTYIRMYKGTVTLSINMRPLIQYTMDKKLKGEQRLQPFVVGHIWESLTNSHPNMRRIKYSNRTLFLRSSPDSL